MSHKHLYLLIPMVALTTGACGVDLDFDGADPRAGDHGVLAFRSEGCTSTTVMAVGATARLRLEALDGEPIPDQLTVSTSAPSVIEAATTTGPGEVVLTAKDRGSSYLSVRRTGLLLDGIGLRAEPARSVRIRAPERVLSGGHADVVIDEAMGLCDGQLCELFGAGFLDWRSEPPGALSLLSEVNRVASFVATDSGTILGRETSLGRDLAQAAVAVVDPEEIAGFEARVVVALNEGAEPVAVSLPASVSTDAFLCLRLDALHPDGSVPVSRQDVTWAIDGEALAPIEDVATQPLCTLVATGAAGVVTLTASSPLFAEQPSFELRLE